MSGSGKQAAVCLKFPHSLVHLKQGNPGGDFFRDVMVEDHESSLMTLSVQDNAGACALPGGLFFEVRDTVHIDRAFRVSADGFVAGRAVFRQIVEKSRQLVKTVLLSFIQQTQEVSHVTFPIWIFIELNVIHGNLLSA